MTQMLFLLNIGSSKLIKKLDVFFSWICDYEACLCGCSMFFLFVNMDLNQLPSICLHIYIYTLKNEEVDMCIYIAMRM